MPDFGLVRAGRVESGVARVAVALVWLAGCSRALRPEPEADARRAPEPAPLASQPGAVLAPAGAASATSAATKGARGVAVVELFTSEGCSSCPPADRVLSRLTERAAAQSLPVYTLSFHVDYWNYLGWTDRFSSSSYSDRQRGYAALDANGGSYTPQAVINGEAECVGSDSSQIDSLIAAALERQPRTRIELEARRTEGGIELGYRVSGETAGRVLNLALLEPRVESAVKSGENAGERLAHVNVVRAFTSRALGPSNAGRWSFAPNGSFDARPLGVIAYAEGAAQRDISGATALELR
jgi:hypothetical protein